MREFELFKNGADEALEPGRWYNFGDNASLRYVKHGRTGKRFELREDESGEVHRAAGPSASDAISWALYRGKPARHYALYCMGARYQENPRPNVIEAAGKFPSPDDAACSCVEPGCPICDCDGGA